MFQRAHRTDRRRAAWVALTAVIGVIALTLSTVTSTASASTVKVDKRMFGLHDASGTALGGSGVKAERLWDTGTTWSDIDDGTDSLGNTVYNWTRLDQLVQAARSKGVEVTLVLGVTPRRFSSDQTKLPSKAIPAFQAYVQAVMQRYGNRIHAYQVWNEPNVADYWTGSISEMAQLTKIVWDARNASGSSALVVSPALTTRLASQRNWIKKYAGAYVGGKHVWKYVDVVGLNLYPKATYGSRPGVPEDSMKLLSQTRDIFAVKGWPTRPFWNTEINYGIRTGPVHGSVPAASNARQAANVLRTYVLNAANGVTRVFWYRWDLGGFKGGGALGNTLLTKTTNHSSLTAGGKAFELAQQWLKGKMVGDKGRQKPCAADKRGTYTCVVRYSKKSYGRIYWNPTRTATVTVAKSARTKQNEYGAKSRIKGNSTLKVSYQPILVRSST